MRRARELAQRLGEEPQLLGYPQILVVGPVGTAEKCEDFA
jgi:hypothetical protein